MRFYFDLEEQRVSSKVVPWHFSFRPGEGSFRGERRTSEESTVIFVGSIWFYSNENAG